MHIGFSTSVIQRGRTGVAQYVFALLKAMLPSLREHGHELSLFVLEEDRPLFNFAVPFAHLLPVSERFRPAVRNILWHQARLPGLVRRHRIDVLHIPSYRRLLWRRPCRLVGTIHDLAPFAVPGKYDRRRMFYGKVVVKRLARRQERVIAISENTARDIVQFFGLPRQKIEVIPNGIDHERFAPGPPAPARAQVADRHGLRKPFLLYVARLEHPGKNHVRLLAAFEAFKFATHLDWQLAFAGSDWSGAEAIHAAIARSPAREDIRCLGFVPDAALPDLYRAAEAFVYPSLYEGFGFPPVEAMACGCPVISSTRGALGEVVGEAAALVEPESIESISKQLISIANDRDLVSCLRAKGFQRAAEFDWKLAAARTLEVYGANAPQKYGR